MTYAVRGNALQIPMAEESVDLIVTSPPYFALRSYRDGDEHYAHQIGSEPTPREFLEALWAAMRECWRVLKPEGSCWVNLGDKYAGSGGHNNSMLGSTSILSQSHKDYHATHGERVDRASRRNAPDSYNKASDVRAKSLMGLPWSFANGCIGAYPFEPGLAAPDGQTWILRAEVCWSKPNGLPESVTDRVRRSHEQWFHLTKSPRYFSSIDEIREPSVSANRPQGTKNGKDHRIEDSSRSAEMKSLTELHLNPLGRLPGSVWTVPSEPLMIPDWARERWNLPDHFAAFPQEFPRRIILGWSPRKGVILDVFGGTGTTAMVAKVLGRTGISLDLSADYCRLADWRINHSGHAKKAESRTWKERQGTML